MTLSMDKSDHLMYAFTLRANTKVDYEDKEEDFDEVFIHWTKYKCYVETKYIEKNKQSSGIHFHGVIRIPKGLFRKKLLVKGFNFLLKEVTSLEGWLKYCTKELPKLL